MNVAGPEPGDARPHGAAFAVSLTILTLVVHLAWEFAQCNALFVHGTYDPSWRGMLAAALGDVVMTWLVYGVVAAVSRRWRWSLGRWRTTQWAAMVPTTLVVAGLVEWRGISRGRWSYTDSMPVVPGLGIGVVPLLQLLALTPLLVALSEALLHRCSGRRRRWPLGPPRGRGG